MILHRIKGNSLVCLSCDGNPPRVAVWQEAFRNFPELPCGADQYQKTKNHPQHAVTQCPSKRPAIRAERGIEDVFQLSIQPPLLFLMLVTQIAPGEHRAESDGNHA